MDNTTPQVLRKQANWEDLYFYQKSNVLYQMTFVFTKRFLTRGDRTIDQMEQMTGADLSDVCTLRGFLYMVRIVQNPAQNGQRYYLDVMQNYEKALKINPNNELAKQLQEKFLEGMKQATK